MVVLNFYGKIEPICISEKLKLYISNLPSDEPYNNWQKSMAEDLKRGIKSFNISGNEMGFDGIEHLYKKVFPEKNADFSNDLIYEELAQNMIYIYFDYNYEDMPLGGWDTNCFDGRLCEEDYAEKIIDFLNFLDWPSADSNIFPSPIPQWIYSSNYDEINYYRLYWGGESAQRYIESLKMWGELIDSFLVEKNDYLLLDYLINSLHKDNEYNEYHLLKSYSLCQLFLENTHEYELDSKLVQFIDEDSEELKKISAEYYRKLRNKIAHGDFVAFESVIEEYTKKVLDGQLDYDYSEYSRKNWAIGHVCISLDSIIRKLIYILFSDRTRLCKIKQSKR